MDAARRRTDLPGFASGLSIHHDDLPVPSFCTLMKRLCNDKLWRIEFCGGQKKIWKLMRHCRLCCANDSRSSMMQILDEDYAKSMKINFYARTDDVDIRRGNIVTSQFWDVFLSIPSVFFIDPALYSPRAASALLWMEIDACQVKKKMLQVFFTSSRATFTTSQKLINDA